MGTHGCDALAFRCLERQRIESLDRVARVALVPREVVSVRAAAGRLSPAPGGGGGGALLRRRFEYALELQLLPPPASSAGVERVALGRPTEEPAPLREIVDAVNDLLLSARGYSDLLADYAGAAELAPAASRHATAASAPPSADAPAEAAADPAPEDAPAPPGVCCICYRRKARVV